MTCHLNFHKNIIIKLLLVQLKISNNFLTNSCFIQFIFGDEIAMVIKKALHTLCLLGFSSTLSAQQPILIEDSVYYPGKKEGLILSGYIQPQFQFAQQKGVRTVEGGDFADGVSNRFMLRRSRVKVEYTLNGLQKNPGMHFAFQFDASERGFNIKDIWGRIQENNWKLFSLTTGLFVRPFGFEVNYSSSDRETPERGRMSQTLLKGERDLGVMISLDARKQIRFLDVLKMDAALFNGPGSRVKSDIDNRKDFIGRISLKPIQLTKDICLGTSVSALLGGIQNNTRYVFNTVLQNGTSMQVKDSSIQNLGSYSPRKYIGADVQIKIKNRIGDIELRAEWVQGIQTATAFSSATPEALLTGYDGFYKRNFKGAYFYFLQKIFSLKHQLVIKYDFYDPNTRVSGKEIGQPGTGFTQADIKYNTLGLGYNYYFSENIKLMLYYANVKNESSSLPGFTKDVRDNVLTTRLQFKF